MHLIFRRLLNSDMMNEVFCISSIESYQFTPSASTQANLYSFTLSISCRQPATHWTYWELCVGKTHIHTNKRRQTHTQFDMHTNKDRQDSTVRRWATMSNNAQKQGEGSMGIRPSFVGVSKENTMKQGPLQWHNRFAFVYARARPWENLEHANFKRQTVPQCSRNKTVASATWIERG